MAQGHDARALAEDGLYPSEAAWRGVADLGCAFSGGECIRWTRIVHLAASLGVVPVRHSMTLVVPGFQLDLLRALAAGCGLTEYADKSRGAVTLTEVRELLVLLCGCLDAGNAHHAVYRGHQAGLLTASDPLPVAFGTAVLA
ncbi:hypothetical protein ACFWBX_06515 [Streptomyces sp. NPDC059991]|uniref:hypothetical protein n=1 Tax=Streptomyces sp. NPDC059991 TaxID=3347028 RepID=UPI0036B29EEC